MRRSLCDDFVQLTVRLERDSKFLAAKLIFNPTSIPIWETSDFVTVRLEEMDRPNDHKVNQDQSFDHVKAEITHCRVKDHRMAGLQCYRF